MTAFMCVQCSHLEESEDLDVSCERCGSAVVVADRAAPRVTRAQLEDQPSGVWRYRAFLPSLSPEETVSLGEGGTPLLRAERLGREVGLSNLLIKDESRNPTGSFMDRGSTVLLSLTRRRGIKECVCITTGNLGASLAAYCARADVRAHLMIHPNTDRGKLYQMLAYGAEIEPISSRPVPRSQHGRTLTVTAANPYLLEGEKTTGFELIQELGWRTPDAIVVPVGTGGHLRMIWQSIIQFRDAGLLDDSQCRLVGVQVKAARLRGAGGRANDGLVARSLPLAELEESVPFFRKEAAKAIHESGGITLGTNSRDIVAATSLLAKTEGIFAEPSSASVIAALSEAVEAGRIDRTETVVCVVTGAGLKDPRAVSRLAKEAKRVALGEPYALPSPQIGGTKFALLRLLRERPSYGYELRRMLGPERQMSMASVYQHLTELEDYAMVRRKGSVLSKGRERIVYELTRRGTDFLKIAGKLERSEWKQRD